jgi:hypothetical protein
MEKGEQRFLIKYSWVKNWGSKAIHQELVITLEADAYGRFQIKTRLLKFRNSDLLSVTHRREAPIGSCLCQKQLDLF